MLAGVCTHIEDCDARGGAVAPRGGWYVCNGVFVLLLTKRVLYMGICVDHTSTSQRHPHVFANTHTHLRIHTQVQWCCLESTLAPHAAALEGGSLYALLCCAPQNSLSSVPMY